MAKEAPVNCIFCKIIKGEIPCQKIYENGTTFAFLDISPINKGHTLVVPKHHCEDIMSAPEKELQDLIVVTKKLSVLIMEAVSADGINIGINNKPAAGQVVMHTHAHIIPRFSNDGLKHWPKIDISNEEMVLIQQKIVSLL